jgi:hypothetical protein
MGLSGYEVEYSKLTSTTKNFRLHPFIHPFALATMVLDVGMGQKRQECGLKYVIQTLRTSMCSSGSND